MSGRGRPKIGPASEIRLPVELWATIDQEATRRGVSRSEVVRQLVRYALVHQMLEEDNE